MRHLLARWAQLTFLTPSTPSIAGACLSTSVLRHELHGAGPCAQAVWASCSPTTLTKTCSLVTFNPERPDDRSTSSGETRGPRHFLLQRSAHTSAAWSPPPPGIEKQKSRTERAARSHAAAVQRIRSCYTPQELAVLVANSRAAAPALLVQAAEQAPHTVAWPISPSDRRLLHGMMGGLTASCAMHLERYTLSELAALLGACVRARYVPGELLLPLQLRLSADARRGQLKDAAADVASLGAHLSRLRVHDPRMWAALGDAATACVDRATLPDVAAVLAAHVRSGAQASPRLLQRAEARAAQDMQAASAQDVATLMWALARSGHSPARQLLRALSYHLELHGAEYGVVQLAAVAGACSKLRIADMQLRWQLASRATQAMREEAAALGFPTTIPEFSASGLLQGLGGASGGGDGSFRSAASRSANTQPVTSQAVAVLVGGVGSMGPARDEEFLRAAAELLCAMAGGGAAGRGVAAAADVVHVVAVAVAAQAAGLAEDHAMLQALLPQRQGTASA